MFQMQKPKQAFLPSKQAFLPSICLSISSMLILVTVSASGVRGGDEPVVSQTVSTGEPAQSPPASEDDFVISIKPFLQNYCLKCHSGDEAEGDMTPIRFQVSLDDVMADLDSWSNVLDVLDHGDMPPEDEKQPSAAELDFVKSWILDTIAKQNEQPKPLATIRRLNRVEYENTIRDLFRLSRPCFNNAATIIQTDDYFQPASGKMPRYVSCGQPV